MKVLGKSILLVGCLLMFAWAIVGLKRHLGVRSDSAPLLSQPAPLPSAEFGTAAVPEGSSLGNRGGGNRSGTQPRVIQAKPIAQEPALGMLTSPRDRELQFDSDPVSPATHPAQAAWEPSRPVLPQDLIPPSLISRETTANPETSKERRSAAARPATREESSTVEISIQPPADRVITRKDDSFWSISEQMYGSGIYYRALFRHNRGKVLRPDQLTAGIEILTPPLEILRQLYPEDVPAGENPAN